MSDIEEVKRRVDVVDLISSYVTLKKAGKDYKAVCPFHKEKTPSFFVSPEKQIYKCFGCGKGGDIFDFVMETEGLEFGDALKILADRAGVQLTPRTKIDREKPGLKSRLFAVNRLAALFYHKILQEHPAGKKAMEYLVSRGIKPATIREFQIGYAPPQGPLTTFLSKKGFTMTEIEQAGRPDRFSRRIIFPIFDVVGNVIGFSGRVLPDRTGNPADQPKYLNTPETAIFHKGRILYGLTQAKKAMKDADQVIVAEGQMDVVMSHQAGVRETIATSGTSLTDDHLHMLYRYTPNLLIAFDTDPAGEKAADRAIMMAVSQGFTVRLIPLAEKDPADLVKTDPQLWTAAIKHAKEAISYIIDRATRDYPNPTADQKKTIAKAVLPYLAALSDPIEQETWIRQLANRLAVSEKTIYLALSKVQSKDKVSVVRQVQPPKTSHLTPAETLVGLAIAYPTKADRVVKELAPDVLESPMLRQVFETLKSQHGEIKKVPGKTRETLARSLSADLAKLVDFLVFSVTHEFSDEQDAAQAMGQLFARVNTRKNEELKRQFATKIAEAEASGNREEVKNLVNQFQTLITKQ